MSSLDLLDTPRRASLTARSTTLRAILKEWEKSFAAAHSGKKPAKKDIKLNIDIDAKYREYNKLRDVLAGRASISELENRKSPSRVKQTKSFTQLLFEVTPRKPRHDFRDLHPNELDPYDTPPSASPRRFFMSSIGPTPQRDGKVLGLFDLLSTSGGSRKSKATPSSESKKRKIDVLTETDGNVVAQTPSRKRVAVAGDILEHLAGDEDFYASGGKNFSRTPASEGKKFMLSQFFATPSTMRFSALIGEDEKDDLDKVDKTPLRTQVLGLGSAGKSKEEQKDASDTTPGFLKRSHSFKDRLLNASTSQTQTNGPKELASPTAIRRGPPTLQRYKSAPKPLSQIVQDMREMEHTGYEDDMEAMREMEGIPLVENSQIQEESDHEPYDSTEEVDYVAPAVKVWKKKGQKRTTKRSVMRPSFVKKAKAPKFVADDDDDDDDGEDEIARVEESQVKAKMQAQINPCIGDWSEDELTAPEWHGEQEEFGDEFKLDELGEDFENPPAEKGETQKKVTKVKEKRKEKKEAGKINPNALSHQNFRSLKIRNKNSRGKGIGQRRKGAGRR